MCEEPPAGRVWRELYVTVITVRWVVWTPQHVGELMISQSVHGQVER